MAGSPWTNQSVNLIVLTEQTMGFSGLFGYSPAPGAGNLIFSLAADAGTDPYGNSYQQGIFTSVGNIQAASYISETAGGGVFIYGMGSSAAPSIFTSSSTFTGPAGYTLAKVECWAGGGGGGYSAGNFDGGGGGGAEYSCEPAYVLVPTDVYTVTVGAAGTGGVAGNGTAGGVSSFTKTGAVTVTANPGGPGTASGLNPATGGAGGTGSPNTIHFNGGNGNSDSGGGASGGRTQAGNNGSPQTGGAAVAGGGPGGNINSSPASGPGGGGGGGGLGSSGSNGAVGQVIVTPYTNTGLTLVAALAGSATTDPLTGTAVPQGLLTQLAYLLPQTAVPATPAADCVLYYKGGSLFAVGPSGNPVNLATT